MNKVSTTSALYEQIIDSKYKADVQHAAHNIKMDKISMWIRAIKISKVVCVSVTASSAVNNLVEPSGLANLITALFAVGSFVIMLLEYYFRYEENKNLLKEQGQKLWFILEKFNNLITDIADNRMEEHIARETRDKLVHELNEIYSNSSLIDKKTFNTARIRIISKSREKNDKTDIKKDSI